MRTVSRMVIAVGAVALLSGCQSFPLTSWMFKGKGAERSQPVELAGNTVGALEEGREHLRSGNVSAAVAAFRVALLDRASRAEASNGLAVAYARLGRDDIAERYFQAAIAAEPENTKYVANLLRLQQSAIARRVAESDTRLAAQSAPSVPVAQQPAEARASLTGGPVVRVSRSEVQVRGAGSGNAPAMTVAYRDMPRPAADRAEPTESPSRIAAATPPAAKAREVENPFAARTGDSADRTPQ